MASDKFPPFSRLFIIGDKHAAEDDYKKTFSSVGDPVSVTLIKDRNGDPKGLVYIQMTRTSEAAKAVELLNGRCLGDTSRPMKVLIATNKAECSSDEDIMAQVSRLFVVVPKTLSEEDVRSVFEKHGRVKKVMTIKDKQTNASKGLAFVTYEKASDAATAYENCDPEYKPKFADPNTKKRLHDDGDLQHPTRRHEGFDRFRCFPNSENPTSSKGPAEFLESYNHENQNYLKVRVPKGLTQNQLTRLFNLIPTLEFCRHLTNEFRTTDEAIIGFSSSGCCAYAKEALQGFEYPPGCPLEVEYYRGPTVANHSADHYGGQNSLSFGSSANAAYSPSRISRPSFVMDVAECETKKRLFIVSQPERIPPRILSDMFAKFGNFISVTYIPGKNYGFAKFADESSANNAKNCMHGEFIGGNHLKCLDAEDPPPDSKKAKTEQTG